MEIVSLISTLLPESGALRIFIYVVVGILLLPFLPKGLFSKFFIALERRRVRKTFLKHFSTYIGKERPKYLRGRWVLSKDAREKVFQRLSILAQVIIQGERRREDRRQTLSGELRESRRVEERRGVHDCESFYSHYLDEAKRAFEKARDAAKGVGIPVIEEWEKY